jgi:hypothetical protein
MLRGPALFGTAKNGEPLLFVIGVGTPLRTIVTV